MEFGDLSKIQEKALERVLQLLNKAGFNDEANRLKINFVHLQAESKTLRRQERAEFYHANVIIDSLNLDREAKDDLRSRLNKREIIIRFLKIAAFSLVTALATLFIKCRYMTYAEINHLTAWDMSAFAPFIVQVHFTSTVAKIARTFGSGKHAMAKVLSKTKLTLSFIPASMTLPVLLFIGNFFMEDCCFEKVRIKLRFTSQDDTNLTQLMTATVINLDEPRTYPIKKRITDYPHESEEIEVIAHKHSPPKLVIKELIGQMGRPLQYDTLDYRPQQKEKVWQYEVVVIK